MRPRLEKLVQFAAPYAGAWVDVEDIASAMALEGTADVRQDIVAQLVAYDVDACLIAGGRGRGGRRAFLAGDDLGLRFRPWLCHIPVAANCSATGPSACRMVLSRYLEVVEEAADRRHVVEKSDRRLIRKRGEYKARPWLPGNVNI